MNDHDIDSSRDAELRDLLQRNTDAPPFDDVDWPARRARITSAAAPLLGMRAPSAAWWQLVATWSTRGVPVAAAAAAAVLVVIGTGLLPDRPAGDGAHGAAIEPVAHAFITLEEELAYGSAALMVASNDSEAVLDALLFYDGEAR
ncbi:hypothetical protein BH23GEM10_BH23GEM10_02490 [soil metagenome]